MKLRVQITDPLPPNENGHVREETVVEVECQVPDVAAAAVRIEALAAWIGMPDRIEVLPSRPPKVRLRAGDQATPLRVRDVREADSE